jgi:hypothetical protein
MTSDDSNAGSRLGVHVAICQEYLQNAYLSLARNEPEKASEFLWGSMTQALKAVAALNEIDLKSHRAIWEYASELAVQLGDQELFNAFKDANSLHSNFYEAGLTLDIVESFAEGIRPAVGRLLAIIPPEVLQQ